MVSCDVCLLEDQTVRRIRRLASAWSGIPSEPFVEIRPAIKPAHPFTLAAPVAPANGYHLAAGVVESMNAVNTRPSRKQNSVEVVILITLM
ncbi:MAG: hypothetical protein WCK47_00995 [bacterium]